MLRKFCVGISLAIALTSPFSLFAESTTCSDPTRARTFDQKTILLPNDDVVKLNADMVSIAPPLGMTSWSVIARNGDGTVTSHDIGIQSEEVSVLILAKWEPEWHKAVVSVERLCIDDSLEPWEGYWQGFLREIEAKGYKLIPAEPKLQ